MKFAEWMGFALDCAHDLALLPVVDAGYSYRCTKCGGVIRVPWTGRIASMNLDGVSKYAREVLGIGEKTELPEIICG